MKPLERVALQMKISQTLESFDGQMTSSQPKDDVRTQAALAVAKLIALNVPNLIIGPARLRGDLSILPDDNPLYVRQGLLRLVFVPHTRRGEAFANEMMAHA
jgi:hypothetical protein